MLSQTSRIASTRLTQLSIQFSTRFSRKINTMATLNTKLKLNTGAEIRTISPDLTHQSDPF